MKQKLSQFKKILPLLLICAACGPKLPPREQSLIAAIPQAPVTLDPRLAADAEGQKIAALLYDGLVRFDNQQRPQPLLAESWEEVEPLKFRFTLKKGVKFSNGAELTSKDVACTYDFIKDPKNASFQRSEFAKIKSLSIIDDLHFDLVLSEPYAPFFLLLKKGIVHCDGKSGTGLYTLESQKAGRRVVLKRNPHSLRTQPRLQYLVFEIVKDDSTRVLKLLNKEVDLVLNGIPPVLIQKVLEKEHLRMMRGPGTTFAYMGLNLRDPILRNLQVRQALAYALDPSAVIQHMWLGFAARADSLLSPTHWAYHSPTTQIQTDLQKAKALLDQAGFPDPDGDGPQSRFKLVFKTSTVKERVEIAKLLSHQLRAVGIDAQVQPNEWGTFFRDVQSGNFQI
ncbi:MAG: ABC transporter substrate-binding protein, partial [Deltaproteobacteria bacterium]|nr:ABC transporter substrate-binding protein [Deltaproteobacteria bacterium]